MKLWKNHPSRLNQRYLHINYKAMEDLAMLMAHSMKESGDSLKGSNLNMEKVL